MQPVGWAVLAGAAIELLLWAGAGLLAWKGVTFMDLSKETRIGGYLYPLRAIGVAVLVGASFAVATVVLLVQFLGR